MFNIDNKVEFEIEGCTLIGTISSIQVNPVTGVTHYIVEIKNGDVYPLLEEDLTPYQHSHISNTFTRNNNEE